MTQEITNKGGRPSKYKEEYCDLIIDSGKKGEYLGEFIADIGVRDSKTLSNWCSAHPEFNDAFLEAARHRTAWRLKHARKLLSKGKSTKDALWDAFLVSKPLRVRGLEEETEDLAIAVDKGSNTYNIHGGVNQISLSKEELELKIKEKLLANPELAKLLEQQEEIIDITPVDEQ
jgi:hypothetical protein